MFVFVPCVRLVSKDTVGQNTREWVIVLQRGTGKEEAKY